MPYSEEFWRLPLIPGARWKGRMPARVSGRQRAPGNALSHTAFSSSANSDLAPGLISSRPGLVWEGQRRRKPRPLEFTFLRTATRPQGRQRKIDARPVAPGRIWPPETAQLVGGHGQRPRGADIRARLCKRRQIDQPADPCRSGAGHPGSRAIECRPPGIWTDFRHRETPDMWSAELMRLVAGRTRQGGTFATYFGSAGWVRRNLQAAGFTVEKNAPVSSRASGAMSGRRSRKA